MTTTTRPGDFAKLFYAEDTGQVLVILFDGRQGPKIALCFNPQGNGVGQLELNFPNSDAGRAEAQEVFRDKIDETAALESVRNYLSN